MLELTDGRIVSAYDSPLGFRHGPKTIVTRDTLLFVFVSNDPYTRRYDLDLLRELRSEALAGRVIAIAARSQDAAPDGEDLHVPHTAGARDEELYYPVHRVRPALAFHRSLSLGNSPINPAVRAR